MGSTTRSEGLLGGFKEKHCGSSGMKRLAFGSFMHNHPEFPFATGNVGSLSLRKAHNTVAESRPSGLAPLIRIFDRKIGGKSLDFREKLCLDDRTPLLYFLSHESGARRC